MGSHPQPPIVSEEIELLERVAETIARPPEARIDPEEPIVRELERVRSQLLSNPDGKDSVSLREQWHRQSSLLKQLRGARGAPAVDPGSPYFAHMRLREDGLERDLCVGRATRIEGVVRIVDWRNAPISRVFYRYRQGDEYEEEFGGRVRTGEVVTRRTVTIRNGALERVEAPEGTFSPVPGSLGEWRRRTREVPRLAGGEAAALRAYGPEESDGQRLGTDGGGAPQRADKHLPEITGLLDPDQFSLISRPSAGFLAIRGTAGSGKTTVALHRIAYLAFDDARVDSEETLVVVFSPALRSYVGHVLPALGIHDVRVVTFHDWAHDQRRRHFPDLPVEQREDTTALDQRMKLHPVLATALAEQVRRTPGPATRVQALDDWASVLTNGRLLAEIAERDAPGAIRREEIRRFVEVNRRRNEEIFARMAGDGSSQAELDPEDDALLLRAHQLRVGPLQHRARRALRYRHVAVDEVQDFAPIEIQVLIDCLDRRRSLTLAGDTQQHLSQQSGFTSWSAFLESLGIAGEKIETLRISYRSSQEIVRFAQAVLGDLREDDEPPMATRMGPPVELFRFTDRGACIGFLGDALRDVSRAEPLASVAVLTPSAEASALYCRGLAMAELPYLRQVIDQDFAFAPGIEVTEIEQAKGLEFDYVVLVDVSAEHFTDRPEARRRLHVGATRAVHQLWLTTVGTPSPLLANIARSGDD